MIFATGHHDEPYLSVYPDSDKISGPGGILLRSSAVGYWHGEGGADEPAEPVREPGMSPPQPVVNVLGTPGPLPEPGMLGATVADLHPGASAGPYHCTYGREEWLLVLAGTPTLRHPHGEDVLEAGDVVCFAEGLDGAHGISNRGASVARTLSLWTTGLPANVFEPDTGRWLIHNGPGGPVELTGGA